MVGATLTQKKRRAVLWGIAFLVLAIAAIIFFAVSTPVEHAASSSGGGGSDSSNLLVWAAVISAAGTFVAGVGAVISALAALAAVRVAQRAPVEVPTARNATRKKKRR
jgi:hypothetical protein